MLNLVPKTNPQDSQGTKSNDFIKKFKAKTQTTAI